MSTDSENDNHAQYSDQDQDYRPDRDSVVSTGPRASKKYRDSRPIGIEGEEPAARHTKLGQGEGEVFGQVEEGITEAIMREAEEVQKAAQEAQNQELHDKLKQEQGQDGEQTTIGQTQVTVEQQNQQPEEEKPAQNQHHAQEPQPQSQQPQAAQTIRPSTHSLAQPGDQAEPAETGSPPLASTHHTLGEEMPEEPPAHQLHEQQQHDHEMEGQGEGGELEVVGRAITVEQIQTQEDGQAGLVEGLEVVGVGIGQGGDLDQQQGQQGEKVQQQEEVLAEDTQVQQEEVNNQQQAQHLYEQQPQHVQEQQLQSQPEHQEPRQQDQQPAQPQQKEIIQTSYTGEPPTQQPAIQNDPVDLSTLPLVSVQSENPSITTADQQQVEQVPQQETIPEQQHRQEQQVEGEHGQGQVQEMGQIRGGLQQEEVVQVEALGQGHQQAHQQQVQGGHIEVKEQQPDVEPQQQIGQVDQHHQHQAQNQQQPQHHQQQQQQQANQQHQQKNQIEQAYNQHIHKQQQQEEATQNMPEQVLTNVVTHHQSQQLIQAPEVHTGQQHYESTTHAYQHQHQGHQQHGHQPQMTAQEFNHEHQHSHEEQKEERPANQEKHEEQPAHNVEAQAVAAVEVATGDHTHREQYIEQKLQALEEASAPHHEDTTPIDNSSAYQLTSLSNLAIEKVSHEPQPAQETVETVEISQVKDYPVEEFSFKKSQPAPGQDSMYAQPSENVPVVSVAPAVEKYEIADSKYEEPSEMEPISKPTAPVVKGQPKETSKQPEEHKTLKQPPRLDLKQSDQLSPTPKAKEQERVENIESVSSNRIMNEMKEPTVQKNRKEKVDTRQPKSCQCTLM